jgi:hypothetical protein
MEYLIQEFWMLFILHDHLLLRNQEDMRVNYTLIVACLHYSHSNLQPIKKHLMFLPGYGPIAIAADWSIIVQCHLLVQSLKWAI